MLGVASGLPLFDPNEKSRTRDNQRVQENDDDDAERLLETRGHGQ